MRHEVVPGSRFSAIITGDSMPAGPDRVVVTELVVDVVVVDVVVDAATGAQSATRVTRLAARETR